VTVGGHLPRLLQLLILGPLIARVAGKQLRIVALKPNKDLAHLNTLYETAGLRCVIDGTYPLHEVPKAVQRFGAAQHIGKVVIAVAP
jgi:NADPH:quinone reductase-like Zn-dependent oxidoreductase